MSYRHDLAFRFAVLKVLVGVLSDAKKAADCEIRDTWRPGDRNSATIPGPDRGVLVGAVTLAKGRTVSKFSDADAFEAWVKHVHPEEIETVTITRVRPAFVERLMSAARQLGHAVDADTGEEVPGITVEQGEPYPTVRLAPAAREEIARAWKAGELADLVGGLLAIEPGESA